MLVAACEGGGASRSDAAKTPPPVSWEGHKLTLEGKTGDATFVMASSDDDEPLTVKAYFSGFPAGTKFTLGKRTGVASAKGEHRTDVSVLANVGKLSLDQVTGDKVDLGLDVTIALPGYRDVHAKVPPFDIAASVASALATVRTSGLRFEGEPTHDGTATSVAVLGPPSAKRKMRVLGPAKQVWDLDWIAIEKRLEQVREKRCGGYQRRIDVVLKMHDSIIEVFDRRIGNVVREGTFKAPGKCPREPLLMPDGSTHAYALGEDVDAWLRDELGSKKK